MHIRKKINYLISELPKWDSTLARIAKIDKTKKIHKMTLNVDDRLFRVNIPKMEEWKGIQEQDMVLVSVDKSSDGKYGKLYNITERTEAKITLK